MQVRFRTTKNDFLDEVCSLFLITHHNDQYVEVFSTLWDMLDEKRFSAIIAEALTAEIYFRGRVEKVDTLEYEELFDELLLRVNEIDRKGLQRVLCDTHSFCNFVYALLIHIEYWVDEVSAPNVTVDKLVKEGGRFDIDFI